MEVIKKNGQTQSWDDTKILQAVKKSCVRANVTLTSEEEKEVLSNVLDKAFDGIEVTKLHLLVEKSLSDVNKDAGLAYKEYRNYKQDFVSIWDEVYQKTKDVMYRGDRENANFLSTLTSTKGSLIRGYVTKELYQRFTLTPEELEATNEGYIYIHDLKDMLFGSINCVYEDGWITIKVDGVVSTIQLKDLQKKFNLKEGITKINNKIEIQSRNGWVDLEGVSIRPLKEKEELFTFKTRNGLGIKATANHRIPVIDANGVESIKFAKDIVEGESLLSTPENVNIDGVDTLNLTDYLEGEGVYVGSVYKLQKYIEYKYGVSAQKFLKDNGIATLKTFKSLPMKAFKKLEALINIPYDIYNSLTLYRHGAKAKLPILLPVSTYLAKMIACIIADGCVSSSEQRGCYQTTFSNTNQELLDDYLLCLKKVFPDVNYYVNSPTEKNTTPCTSITIANAVVWEFFRNFKRNSSDIELPNFITNNQEDIKYSYIGASLDCDGSWGGQVVYTTVCKKYAEQYSLLLSSLGMKPTINETLSKGTTYKSGINVGKRNYNTYQVKLSNIKDITNLKGNLDSYKSKYYKLSERKGVYHNPDKIRKISVSYDTGNVFDLETSDSWFSVNDIIVHNCCLFNMSAVLKGGFEMSNLKYAEPTSALSALQVIGDVILSASAQEFGGFTVPQIDEIVIPYCKKTIIQAEKDAKRWGIEDIEKYKTEILKKELRQGFQSLEMKLNSIPSSRGDFAFTTFSFGSLVQDNKEEREIQKLVCETMLEVRMKGQGKGEPVVFPKYVFLFSLEQYDKYEDYQSLVDLGIECSSKALYPDWLCIDGKGSVGDIYRDSGQIVSPMGCRAYLSDFKDENDKTVITSRANIGAVALNLPMIWQKSKGKTFYEDLDYYMQMIREFHCKRYEQIANTPCSSNPVAFTQGGLYKGTKELTDNIGYDIVESFTASFGITALNELNVLMEGKPLHESDRKGVNVVVDYLKEKLESFKKEDGWLYAWYGVPAESLGSTQLNQFKAKFGVIEGVSDREYFSNSFHAHVSADITPFEKQDIEEELFHKIEGGHIQYTRFNNPSNTEAIKSTILRGMRKGFYSGVNFDLVICESCGHRPDHDVEVCPECGSRKIMALARACGYISYRKVDGDTRFNDGKLAEIRDRVSM